MPRRMIMDRRMMRVPRQMRRMDMGMYHNYPYDYGMMEDGRRRRNAKGQYMADRAYEYETPHESKDYGSFHEERGFRPVEAMGYFTGYYGGGDSRRDMRYDGNYPYPRMDYGYDFGDYGESLTKDELEEWRKKLDREVGDEQSKHFFKRENIEQKARQMGVEMKNYNAEELAIASYMLYSDYCKSLKPYVGQNMDVFVKMGEEFLNDPDSAVKGGEKLALYYEIVAGEDD